MILKIQAALFPKGAPALIYDQSRKFQRTIPAAELPALVRAALAINPRVFFEANVSGSNIEWGTQVPHQNW